MTTIVANGAGSVELTPERAGGDAPRRAVAEGRRHPGRLRRPHGRLTSTHPRGAGLTPRRPPQH